MPVNTVQDRGERLDYLDSTRGIAAMMVMYFHFVPAQYYNMKWPHVFFMFANGTEAVSFFFVLSGFVLSYKYIVRGKKMDIGAFYINRIFRIWPAFFVAVLLNALFVNRADLSPHALYDLFLTGKQQFWQEVSLIRGNSKFYKPGWTLSIELAVSFFMPFAILLAGKNRKLIWWLILAILLEGNTKMTVFHMHFALGLILACYYNEIRSESFRQSKWYRYRYIILPFAYVLWAIRHLDGMYPFGPIFENVTDFLQLGFYFLSGIAAFVFIGAFIESVNAQRILNHKLLVFIGKISYGLYLTHSLFRAMLFNNWDAIRVFFGSEKTAIIAAVFIYTIATFALATLFYYTIELPFIKVGKKIVARFRPAYVE